jgi:hypothetical protein
MQSTGVGGGASAGFSVSAQWAAADGCACAPAAGPPIIASGAKTRARKVSHLRRSVADMSAQIGASASACNAGRFPAASKLRKEDPMPKAVRRIVTGHDSEGRSVVQEDGPPARVVTLGGDSGTTFHEIWNTRSTPAPIDRASGEPAETGISLLPPAGGTRIRILDIPPDDGTVAALPREAVRALFEAIGAGHTLPEDPPHPLMHRTETIDYGIVLEGELVLILDASETVVRAGDIVVQRGTSHAWANRSTSNARIAFVLVDGRFERGLEG